MFCKAKRIRTLSVVQLLNFFIFIPWEGDLFDFQSMIVGMLSSLSPSSITNLFIAIMIIGFIFGLYSYHQKEHPNYVNSAPSILTSIGILGTFAGIVIGLIGFDTADIDKSIPILLEGLKVAFISSLVGVFLSIGFKVALNFIPNDEADISEVDDLITALKRIENGINADDGRSIYSQLRSLRDEEKEERKASEERLNVFSDKLWQKFSDFSEQLSESATKQVIEALENVITDFNTNLKEQFGENFKLLNESVKDLVVWQENYKTQMAEMTQQYKLSVESISSTESAIQSIKENTSGISEVAQKLKSLIETNQNQINNLDEQLKAFASIKDKAIDSMPVIEDSLNTLTQEIRKTTKEAQDQISQMDKALAKEIENKLSEMGSALGSITSKFTSDYQNLVKEMQSVVSQR